jgi:predicted amidophosphoribosyltransferase
VPTRPATATDRYEPTDRDVGCKVCGRAVPEWGSGRLPVCFCCRTVADQLGVPLVPLVPLTEYRVGDATHRRLRAYKDAPVAEARELCRVKLVAELARRYDDALTGLGAWTVVTTVPSSVRPGGAPAERLVDGVARLAERHLRLLVRGQGSGGHLQAGREIFALDVGVDRPGLTGLSVLVFDDTTTTGAAAQSAAASLRLAGARVVGILVMGRALASGTDVPVCVGTDGPVLQGT